MQAHGIMFHHFHNENHPRAQGSLDASALREMLAYLSKSHRILNAEEFQSRTMEGCLRPDDICLTFDDSLRCQFDVAYPVLEDLGLTAFWFIYTSPMQGTLERLELYRFFRNTAYACVEDFYASFLNHVQSTQYAELAAKARLDFDPTAFMARCPGYSYEDCLFRHLRDEVFGEDIYHELMDSILRIRGIDTSELLTKLWVGPEEVIALRRSRHVIGLHSHTHPTRIGNFPIERQREEYVTNKRILEGLLGEPVVSMSHPSNSYGPETLEVLREIGAKVGFRAFMAGGEGCDLELPRQDHSNIMRQMRGLS